MCLSSPGGGVMVSLFEEITAGQAVILVASVSVLGSSGPNCCEDSCVLLSYDDDVCSSAGFVYGAWSYFKVNVCGGLVDGSGYGSSGFGYG